MGLTIDTTGKDQKQPNPGGQADFCADWDNRFIALEGGWSSGKTFAGARKLLTLHIDNAYDDYGKATDVPSVLVAPTYQNALDFMIPALREACDDINLTSAFRSGRMNFVFTNAKQPLPPIMVRTAEKPERITGWQVGAAWGDEPARWNEDDNEPKRDPLTQLLGRVRHPRARNLQTMFTYTNEGDHTKIYDLFHSGKPSHAIYRAETTENPVNSAEWVNDMMLLLTEDLQKQYIKGEALSLRGGKVYSSYDANKHGINDTLTLTHGMPLQLAVDFNIAPGMHGMIGQYNPAADYFTTVHEIHGPRMHVIEMCEVFKTLLDEIGAGNFPHLEVYGDATGRAEWSGNGLSNYVILQEALKDIGIPFKFLFPMSNPPVVDRVNAVNMALMDAAGVSHWHIHPRCMRLKADLQKMKRDKYGRVVKSDQKLSHASDADGYRIHVQRPARQLRRTTMGQVNV